MGSIRRFTACLIFYLCIVKVSSIDIQKNVYKGISISVSGSVQEQHFDLKKLQEVLITSSELIYHATRKRSYFGEFIISLPSSWTAQSCTEFTRRASKNIDIHLSNSHKESSLRAKHSKGCGSEGDMIYMPLHWLSGDTTDLAHQFVKQWSIYRYGVFEEEPVKEESCHMSGNSWSPVGCYNIKISSEATFVDGVPVCSLPSDFSEQDELRSSLMSVINSSKALDFCDGSPKFPHNPVMPTLHNNLCKGKTVWSVIENSKDFKYGRNLPLATDAPPMIPVFKCFKEEPIHVTFAIQNNTVKTDLSEAMTQIGSSLFEFLWNLAPRDCIANVVMFSDKEDKSPSLELDVTNPKKLSDALEYRVKTDRPVITSTCLSCGFEKALKAVRDSSSSPIVVLIAWESSLINEKTSELIDTIQKYPDNVRLHLILVEDTEADVLPSNLIHAIKSLGGLIYSLPGRLVFMASKLQTILAGVMKNPLQVEDQIVVVHEANYHNISESFNDFFVMPSGSFSKMVYIMYCDPNRNAVIRSGNPNCSSLGRPPTSSDGTFKCGEVTEFSDKTVSMRNWEYPFSYLGSTAYLYCSSVSMLRVSSSSDSFTLRGWLNEHVISITENALIIYAEVIGAFAQKFKVEAHISGPGMPSPVTIELRDNGNGDPDVKAGDGIYSRYFTSFSEKGAYTVSVSAELLTNENTDFLIEGNRNQVSNPMQRKTIGFCSVIGSVPQVDIFPPNRVVDLSVMSVNHVNRSVVLQWTAPGDDYDSGNATGYEIKFSQQPSSLSELYFNGDENFWLYSVGSPNPHASGETEIFEFRFPETYDSEISYVAVRAFDENNNTGDISNIVQIHLNKSGENITDNPFGSTEMTKLPSTEDSSTSPEITDITNNSTTQTPDIPEISSTIDGNNTTIVPPQPENEKFFDEKTIIILSSVSGILLLIIIINIIICCCCIKKRNPGPKKLSRKASLRPPYNLNIAYQDESNSSTPTDNYAAISMSTLVDRNEYSEPEAKNKATQQSYSYHTARSLQDKAKKDSELGFKLVQAVPAYATRSLSRYANRLQDDDIESETGIKSAVPQPQVPSTMRDAQVYPLGVV